MFAQDSNFWRPGNHTLPPPSLNKACDYVFTCQSVIGSRTVLFKDLGFAALWVKHLFRAKRSISINSKRTLRNIYSLFSPLERLDQMDISELLPLSLEDSMPSTTNRATRTGLSITTLPTDAIVGIFDQVKQQLAALTSLICLTLRCVVARSPGQTALC